ncbi:MAG: DedA family protein [Planctomycetota bacterium]|jgi:membrane protein DedA with SNARE-associated domain
MALVVCAVGLSAIAAGPAGRPEDWGTKLVSGVIDEGFVVLVAAIILATLVSEDLTCIGCGLLAAKGDIPIGVALLGCFLGLWIGDFLLYWAGRLIGRPMLKVPPFKWMIREAAVARGTAWLKERGAIVVFIGRFVPGSRLPTYFAAGLLHTNGVAFAGYFAMAAAVWVPLLVGGTYLAGEGLAQRITNVVGSPLLGLVLLGGSLMLILKLIEPVFSHRGRRLLLASWRRTFRWEFWPAWLANIPVVIHWLWLSVKHRDWVLFTAGNPGIKLGGFVGESKIEILRSLDLPPAFRLATSLIEPDGHPQNHLACVLSFMADNGLTYPIVLKPDCGERGKGVRVVRDDDEARDALARCRRPMIVQEYAPGEEFGVFYYRYPAAERGVIFSMTEKIFPRVTGDGHRTLEELILDDDRAACMARRYLQVNARRLEHIPENGEEIQLCEIGNHAQGAIFRDGRGFKTAEMVTVFDRISRRFDGFYFGRFDVRTPSVSDLQRGENFKVIELNGVTSEATHIYDPTIPIRQAYRTLFQQWRILFEISAQTVAAGAVPTPWWRVARALSRHWFLGD